MGEASMLMEMDFASDTPIYQQIRDQVVLGIAKGELALGESLPTVRAMSDEIGVNAMTISKGYQLLKEEGYITTDRRSGTRVSESIVTSDKAKVFFLEKLTLILAEAKVHGLNLDDINQQAKNVYETFEKG
jgi:DNA-binding transcriptional regulator YhcF (GntR family)